MSPYTQSSLIAYRQRTAKSAWIGRHTEPITTTTPPNPKSAVRGLPAQCAERGLVTTGARRRTGVDRPLGPIFLSRTAGPPNAFVISGPLAWSLRRLASVEVLSCASPRTVSRHWLCHRRGSCPMLSRRREGDVVVKHLSDGSSKSDRRQASPRSGAKPQRTCAGPQAASSAPRPPAGGAARGRRVR